MGTGGLLPRSLKRPEHETNYSFDFSTGVKSAHSFSYITPTYMWLYVFTDVHLRHGGDLKIVRFQVLVQ
jgi:hypothetical protein